MNIALIAHDAKKELMVQFCIAYCGILSRHSLCATGTTVVDDVRFIERGYENFVGKLKALGADIECVDEPEEPEDADKVVSIS